MTEERKAILYVLGLAFVGIRGSERHDHAKILADIFHNVPGMIANGEEPVAIMNAVKIKAERHNYTAYVARMFQMRSPLLSDMLGNP